MKRFLHYLRGAAIFLAAPAFAQAGDAPDLPGQNKDNPIATSVSENEIPSFSPVYYMFSPTESCKIEISSDIEGTEFTVIEKGEEWYLDEELVLSPTEDGYLFKVDSSKQYLITLTKPEGEEETTGILSLENIPFSPGEAWQTAIDAAPGEVTLPNGPSGVWYKVVSPKDGIFVLTTTMAGSYSNSILVYKKEVNEDMMSRLPLSGYPPVFGTFKTGVSKDEVLYIFFKNILEQEAPTANFSFEEAAPGEAYSNPIKIDFKEPSIEYKFPADIPYNQPKWYSLDLPAGILDCVSDLSFTVDLYSAEDPYTVIKNGGWNPDFQGFKGAVIPEAGTYLLAVYATDSEEVEVTITIREPEPGETLETAIVLDLTQSPITTALPAISGSEYWIKFNVHPGILNILPESSMDYLSGSLYEYDGENLNKLSSINYIEIDQEYFMGISDFEVTGSKTYVLCIDYNNISTTLTFSGPAVEPREQINVRVNVINGISYYLTVPNNKDCTISLNLPEDWQIKDMTVNGDTEEVHDSYTFTANDEDVEFVFTVDYAGALEIVDTTTGVVSIDSKVNIEVTNNGVHIYGLNEGDVINVYSVGGMVLYSNKAQADKVDINLPTGTYIVRVNKSAVKILI